MLALSLPALMQSAIGQATNASDPVAFLTKLEIQDEKGNALPLLSPEAYRAEFRYLRRIYHQIDLKGPAVETDGWTYNIPEAEWPFMGVAYFGYACCNLAKYDPTIRDDALAEARWCIEALQTLRLSGFITPHIGPPFGTNEIKAATFVHGHFLSLAVRYRDVSGDSRHDAMIHRVAEALAKAYTANDQAILRSYKDMWWITDNCPSLSALARYGILFKRDTSKIRSRFIQSVRDHYLDRPTGLFATYVDPKTYRQLQGPRGVSVMYGLQFMRDIDSKFATEQYTLAKSHFIRTTFGLTAAREFPEGVDGRGDVDSGPLILGLGPSASGFAIAAAAVMDDFETAMQLARSSVIVGSPKLSNGELQYTMMPTVGQSVILFGKALLLKSRE